MGENCVVTDDIRWDGHLEAISLSITNPNYFYMKRVIERGFDLCILHISSEILLLDCPRIYCQTNAATKYAKKGTGFEDFKSLFDDEIIYSTSYANKIIKRESQLDNEPTDE